MEPYLWKPPPKSDESHRPDNGNGCYATPEVPRSNYTYHSWTWKGTHDLIKTHHQIPLELFSGPIFFTHGEKDKLWCVSKATTMRDHLKKTGKYAEVHIFPGEGHKFSSEAENKRLSLLINFFERNLK